MDCPDCGAHMRTDNLARHRGAPVCETYECDHCGETCPLLHRKQHLKTHRPTVSHEERRPAADPVLPSYEIDDEYVDIYTTFAKHIEPQIKKGKCTNVYNFQIGEFGVRSISTLARQVFDAQASSFKIAISLGVILRNIETNELCYYWASQNNQLLMDTPRLIRNEGDMVGLCDEILQKDLRKHVTYPNTKYTFVKCTNVSFYVTRLSNVAIGAPIDLPEYLVKNKGLYSLTKSNQSGKPYDDRFCFFRALALHRGAKISALEVPAKRLLREYCDRVAIGVKDFCGISLDQLEDASKIFNVGINVYAQDKDRITDLIFRSIKQDDIMYLNLYVDHFSYVKNFDLYSKSYCCPKCRKIWTRHWDFKRHVKSCDAGTRSTYGNGIFKPTQSIFEQLEVHGIEIPEELRIYEYRICYDIECTLSRDTGVSDTARVSYSFKHDLASISICSNVPGFLKPTCLISDGCPKKLVKKFVDSMIEIAKVARELQSEKFDEYMLDIEELEDTGLQQRFEDYISQIPVLSFNGNYSDYIIAVII